MAPSKKRKITMGVELESYSISLPENRICRDLHFPKKSTIEKGERFTRDWSIGTEYNSKVFCTIREAFFLLKTGLRKYTEFRQQPKADKWYVIFPVGGWSDRFAGGHIHIALGKHKLDYQHAKSLAGYLHDHIPFIVALCANSPVWRDKITPYSSSRLVRGSNKYCKVTRQGTLYKHHYRELTYNEQSRKKPPTLELRVSDSSLPEYLIAALSVCRAVTLRWLRRGSPLNRSTHENYLKAREQAIRYGVKARLVWTNHWMSVPNYVDLFFRKYREELEGMDVPEEVLRSFKYLKRGWNQAEVLRKAAEKYRRRHRPTWQKQFAKRYATAIRDLLNGNTFEQFALTLGVKLPRVDRIWLGKKDAPW